MMGAGLVKAAYALADARRFQDHKAMRPLVFMAVTALDTDPRPTFYGGPEALARALAITDDSAVRRSLRNLTSAGLIERTRAHIGKRATYCLMDGNGRPLSPVDNSDKTGQTAPALMPTGGANRPATNRREAGRIDPRGGADRPGETGQIAPPKEEEDKEEEGRARAHAPVPLPIRTCTRHASWDHDEPCRACGNDRRAAEAHAANRRPLTMSPAPTTCAPGTHAFNAVSGYCDRCGTRDDDTTILGRAS